MSWYEYTNGAITGRYSDHLDGLVDLPDDHPDVVAFLNPPPPPYTIFKTTLWMRLSNEEAETVMAAKEAQPAKFRGIWDDALLIQSDSQFFETLKLFLASTLSSARAKELLLPEVSE
jgi:hypothetical protein